MESAFQSHSHGQNNSVVAAGKNSTVFHGAVLLSYGIALPYELSRIFSILKREFFCEGKASRNYLWVSKNDQSHQCRQGMQA
ncbi:hypothetical protein Pan161_39820 [Gimesia algae]|uniref:Uncharacterized protein n=1 Tax=Gimesia algae TaxID=2527971 RepID=A0A517VH58_9PLAN|nr:hypothetical protein Pan161_39820 [Gimesia algae]